jgi:hypothetical protein
MTDNSALAVKGHTKEPSHGHGTNGVVDFKLEAEIFPAITKQTRWPQQNLLPDIGDSEVHVLSDSRFPLNTEQTNVANMERTKFLAHLLRHGLHEVRSEDTRLIMAITQLLQQAHSPEEHFVKLIDAALEERGAYSKQSNGSVEGTLEEGKRPDYYKANRGVFHANALVAKSGVYNQVHFYKGNGVEPKGLSYNINLSWPELAQVRNACVSRLQQGDFYAVLPFHSEPHTVDLNVLYATGILGSNTLLVSTGKCKISEAIASHAGSKEGARIVRQNEIFDCVDWNVVSKKFGVPIMPDNGPPPGNKGLTVYAGLIAMHAMGKLESQKVLFSDTDFTHPAEYDSFAYLALPFILNPDLNPKMVMTARTGPGRNNEMWTSRVRAIANDQSNVDVARKIALICESLVWPLGGNRMVSGEMLSRIPWTTAMGLETQMNIFAASEQITHRSANQLTAQVCNPSAVRERGVADPEREFAHIEHCARWADLVIKRAGKTDKPLNEWEQKHVAIFNRHDIKNTVGLFQSNYLSKQALQQLAPEYMLPSIDMLIAANAVDWNKVRSRIYRCNSKP